jgi:WD40 repeat protein
MSGAVNAPGVGTLKGLADTHGATVDFGAYVVGVAFLGQRATFALGDGSVAFLTNEGPGARVEGVHDGAILCSTLGPFGDLITGGDDGAVKRVRPDGAVQAMADLGAGWIEAIAYAGGPHGMLVGARGRTVSIIAPDGAVKAKFDHPSTVSAVAFDKTGRRVASAHVNGVTLSWATNPDSRQKVLAWKGAHSDVLFSPDGKFLVTAMQENALHGWRLQDGQHFRMAGYPAKIRQLAFTPDGKWLITAGAEELVMWPFQTADGPMGKSASVPGGLGAPISAVACHPRMAFCAAGGADGEIALIPITGGKPFLVDAPREARVTALAWSGDGAKLAFGTEAGRAGVVDLTQLAQG